MEIRDKVLIVEDEKSICLLMQSILEAHGYDVITAENGSDGVEMVNSHCPDVVLLDLGLPDMDGMDFIEKIRKWTAIPVIVVSARGMEQDKVAALEMGADDYIPKPFGKSELLARVKVALRHSHCAGSNPDIAVKNRYEVGALVVDYDKYRVYVNNQDMDLTKNEYKLVALLGRYAGKVLTYDFILQQLWGPNAKKSDNQILRVNMANIRRKIETDPAKPRYIITEVGIGYRLADELDSEDETAVLK